MVPQIRKTDALLILLKHDSQFALDYINVHNTLQLYIYLYIETKPTKESVHKY